MLDERLILTPAAGNELRVTLGEAHRCHTRTINFREGGRGRLFQGCFASHPMDDAHLIAAVRYVEKNPVAAKMVERAEAYRWSSARSHVADKQSKDDPLTYLGPLEGVVTNWKAMLRYGLDAGDVGKDGAAFADAIEARLRTGRPLAAEGWIERQEKRLGRRLRRRKPGPKPKAQKEAENASRGLVIHE